MIIGDNRETKPLVTSAPEYGFSLPNEDGWS